ncbi:MAG: IS21 family transposase [Blastococcus sp.]
MKSVKERMDVVAAYRQVGTYRGAAVMCGTTHKTVQRIVARHEAGGQPPARAPRGRNYDAVAEVVAQRVAETKGRLSAKRLLPEARAAGYAGSARNFRRLVATARKRWRRDQHRGRRPGVWAPGETLLIDWGVADGVHVFFAVLGWSRFRFVRFAGDERAVTTLALLAECFEVLGGVPKVVLADRMGCLKAGVVADVVVPTADYVRFATAYGFRPDFCQAADPQSKGMVENLVGYAKRDLLVPQAPDTELAAANGAARTWCAQVNAVTHSEICAVPAERLAAEREVLGALPQLRPRIGKAEARKVDKLSCVRIGSARYSVPSTAIGTTVEVVVADGRVSMIDQASGEVLADHAVVAPGEASIVDAHYPQARPAPRRAVRPKTADEKAFCAFGEIAEKFIKDAAAAGVGRLAGEVAEILTLEAAHGREPLLAALRRAVAFGRFKAADVRSILAAGAGTPTPRPAGDALVEELPTVPTRPLSAYALDRTEASS